MARTLATLALLVLVLPPLAEANVNPATDPLGSGMAGVALGYWRAQGVAECPGGVEFLYDDSITSLGLGGGCVARLRTGYVQDLRSPAWDRATRRFMAGLECQAWTHEVGHALGLEHTTERSVMNPGMWAVPAECRAFARATYPPRKRRHWAFGASRRR